jgi:uncharacterized membrane protein
MNIQALKRLRSGQRLLVAIAISLLSLFFVPRWLHISARLLIVWDTGTLVFLGLTWWAMLNRTPDRIRHFSNQRELRWWLWSLSLAILFIALAIFYIVNINPKATAAMVALHIVLSGITIINSWLLVHTIFARHYAHDYYREDAQTREITGGLDFPHDREPDYLDFLYFSFVIGMTSQVSDVAITSRSLRRVSLVHGILSFFFNTTILAITINLVGALI